jgi:hypothetical protein
LRGINYRPHYQTLAAGFRCPFGFCQRLIILWPMPNKTIRALVGLRWLALFQFLDPSNYLIAGHGCSLQFQACSNAVVSDDNAILDDGL